MITKVVRVFILIIVLTSIARLAILRMRNRKHQEQQRHSEETIVPVDQEQVLGKAMAKEEAKQASHSGDGFVRVGRNSAGVRAELLQLRDQQRSKLLPAARRALGNSCFVRSPLWLSCMRLASEKRKQCSSLCSKYCPRIAQLSCLEQPIRHVKKYLPPIIHEQQDQEWPSV